MVEQLVIIGSGPAGYTAAIYAARAQLEPLMFEGFSAGGLPGGQLMTTTEVENFPGFSEGIQGPQLMKEMRQQALRWGTKLITDDVVKVDFADRPFTIVADELEVKTNAVIIATGATAKRLNIQGEERFWNNGISACAICDGTNPLFQNVEIAVVGGGDSAAEEALYLTKYASKVHLLVRSDRLRASKVMQERIFNHDKIQIHWQVIPISAHGDDVLQSIQMQNLKDHYVSELKVGGLFYAIGHTPNTQIFANQIDLDDKGYIKTFGKSTSTNIAGVWAAGDVQDHIYRQAITAAGSGCMAALEAERWLMQK
ncbi:MAG: thioredoxin-disulfide reductase [Pseudanabaena sp.]|jgi:thioredoxin reductase (NADPH)|nr:thioredoxin-disulfide reductase [Pseudanabaena sp. M53BS1SP1A06MG]MCA6583191.1 thioredoxin-disulfide reductase [Pseudanabaena sp. M34BS1SP1A06MG]MCA6585364.1 thioredoxin-disulfide reductase [Pseudanabaena sp. M051S1SP1A06QC]MCA6589058.1 thioredoxin-disulfide reductase [Pseudanabaena sp. M109S1SP1A06QC]MCA6593723.1 thioredoxin-disulfide reductase [Pseudanabaena sp. M38BS1SP1A06MG]MCA6598365.1 thioredoxin-disulfide reductase [Pseudanabaena sp. M046S1SP1A06QC]MCA6606725.1 thioredoxin-disulfid